MRRISTEGFRKPKAISPGEDPTLQWLPIGCLVVDPAYRRPIEGTSRREVNRIARAFRWSRFSPVVVAPTEKGSFAIIDGQRRTAAAALIGLERVPCQIVAANQKEQLRAFKAINGGPAVASRMARYAAALGTRDSWAMRLADICRRAEVELLRYPVPVNRQMAGQTMAVGAIAQCLRRYGEETLITALQCVTQTTNNRPGLLSARMIKVLCAVLDGDRERRDSGLVLLEAFDTIDLAELERSAVAEAPKTHVKSTELLTNKIRHELKVRLSRKLSTRQRLRVGHINRSVA
jgi:hypothetical protein